MEVKVSIIVSIDGSFELNQNFIEHLFSIGLPQDYEVIAITDGINNNLLIQYLAGCAQKYPQLHIITNQKVGYSKANNIAVQQAQGKLLLFLNNDVFPAKKSIEKMVKYIEQADGIGVVQGLLLYAGSKLVQSTGHIFGRFFNFHALEGRSHSEWIVNEIQERQGLSSAFFLLQKSVFLEKGGFDEFYYNAWEGLDISLAIHFSGYKCIYYPLSVAYHIRFGTRKEIVVSNEAQQIAYFWSKWGHIIKDDLRILLKLQIERINPAFNYLAINAAIISSPNEILEASGLNFSDCIDIRERFSKNIDFYQNISYSVKSFEGPLLFLVNTIQDVASNKYWVQTRNNANDLIMDLRGNVLPLIELF